MRQTVIEMLRTIADLRAVGDKPGAVRFRQQYVYTDSLKPEIEARTADLPQGTGLVFPRLKMVNGRYQREWVYPVRFEDQPKFAFELPPEVT